MGSVDEAWWARPTRSKVSQNIRRCPPAAPLHRDPCGCARRLTDQALCLVVVCNPSSDFSTYRTVSSVKAVFFSVKTIGPGRAEKNPPGGGFLVVGQESMTAIRPSRYFSTRSRSASTCDFTGYFFHTGCHCWIFSKLHAEFAATTLKSLSDCRDQLVV